MLRRKQERFELIIVIVTIITYCVFGLYIIYSNTDTKSTVPVNAVSVCGELG